MCPLSAQSLQVAEELRQRIGDTEPAWGSLGWLVDRLLEAAGLTSGAGSTDALDLLPGDLTLLRLVLEEVDAGRGSALAELVYA